MNTILTADRITRAKRAFATRTVPAAALRMVTDTLGAPSAGDLALARVVSVGQHERVELTTSRKALLFVGDEVIVCFGARYAPDQYEAEVPRDLGPCALAAAGGIAGSVISGNARMEEPTMIQPIGVFVDERGHAVNVRDFALPSRRPARKVPAIAVVGGSMNAGKTTTAASIVHGFAQAGFKVGAAKLTGTGAGNDYWHMSDAGAHAILDFTDAGLATTYKASRADLERCANTLAAGLVDQGAEVLVFEIADGLFQQETAWMVASPVLEGLVDAYVYAAEGSASAVMGAQWLRAHNRTILGLSGIVSASPLATRETVLATGLPCLTKDELATAANGADWMRKLTAEPARAAA